MFRSVCPKPSMHIYAATCPDLGFIHSVQLMAIIWPANWLLRKYCKNMQSTHGYIQSSIHIRWMDGQPQNQAGECLQFHIISSSPLTYWESLSKRSHGSHGRLVLNLQDLCLQAMMNFSCSSKPVTQCVYHNSAGSVCDFVVSECSLRQNTLQGST